MGRISVLFLVVVLSWSRATAVFAQTVSNRGFAESAIAVFPEDAPNDPVNAVTDVLLRDELFVKPAAWLQFAGGLDLRLNTHDQVERSWRIDLTDRTILRPAVSARRLSATIARGPVTIDAGKQFIRWGKTDIVTPTDHFAPRDFLNVINSEFLAVWGARGVVQIGAHTIDLVWVPQFTPSRTPLLNQRWAPAPAAPSAAALVDLGAVIPEGSQAGLRYSRVGERLEYSVSVFNGFNHLPNIEASPLFSAEHAPTPTFVVPPGAVLIGVRRVYPTMRSYGADLALPTRWFAIKGETAYSTSDTPGTDDYLLYVIQLERQSGEWQFVGGYAGEVVTARRAAVTFAPDRGLARAIIARAAYTIGPDRNVGLEGAVRQNGRGVYSKVEYSQTYGQHWRATISGVVIGGQSDDFLGQYHDNSHIAAALRYSF
jgi:hypothetical protein